MRPGLRAIEQLRRGGRTAEAMLMAAGKLAVEQNPEGAVDLLERFVREMPPGSAGWTIPIDPLFTPLSATPIYSRVLRRLAQRAE